MINYGATPGEAASKLTGELSGTWIPIFAGFAVQMFFSSGSRLYNGFL
jgi:hypothetical protein